MKKSVVIYLAVAFLWTWICWIGAFILADFWGFVLDTGSSIFNLFSLTKQSNVLMVQLLFALAVYGPILGYFIAGGQKQPKCKKNSTSKFWILALCIPIIMMVPALIFSLLFGKFNAEATSFWSIFISVVLYAISNFITSGTEEFGWRGFLYPYLKSTSKNFQSAAWIGGFIWALWHYPLMIMMYRSLGISVMIPYLIGFTAGIVAMSYISNYIYEKSGSLIMVMTLHALNNTMSFLMLLLFPKTPFAIISSLMSWAVVWYLDKKDPLNFTLHAD